MEKRAREFLELSGRLYEANKNKWKKMVDDFNEDVYNDTILKVYDSILKGEDIEGDLIGYWYKSFKTNIKRYKDYSYEKNKDTKDVLEYLKGKEDEENRVNVYYSEISDILLKVKQKFDRKTFEIFRMYLLCNVSYERLDELTGLDSKERISKVRRWLNAKGKKV